MTPKDRKKLLIDKDLTMTELAKRINRDRSWVVQTMHGHVMPRPTQEAIAKELGLTVEIIFPHDKVPKRAA